MASIRFWKSICLLLPSLFALCFGQLRATAATINFDDAADGANINTRYPGVTFSNPVGGNIFARSGAGSAPSSPNVVSVAGTGLALFDARQGAVEAAFATPVGSVSIDARPVAPPEFVGALTKKPFFEVYATNGVLIGQIYYQGALPTTGGAAGPVETISFTSTVNNIGRVRFSSQNPGSPPTVPPTYGMFDNLRFDRIFSLAASATAGGSVRMSPEQSQFIEGAMVTLSATPLPGWRFSHWSGDASSTVNPLQVTMNANTTIFANFVLVPTLPTPEAGICMDFNSGVPARVQLFGDAQVDAGRLKLFTVGQPNSFGIAYINDFNGGAPVAGFRATFKAMLFGSSCCAGGFFPADGFSFNLVPAATVSSNPGYAEPAEEGSTNGLSVNFDTWDNGGGEAPAIDVKWLGETIASASFQASQSPNGITDPVAASRDVVINLDPDGTIDVSYGGVSVMNNVQTPYRASKVGAPKWVFGARVGLANDNYWIDDLCISTIAGGRLCNDFDSGVPAGTTLFGNAQVDDGRLKLYTIPQDGGFGIAYFDDFSGGQFVKAFRATFKAALFGSTCCGGGAFPADGFSFNLVPAVGVLSNPGYGQPAEEGLEEGLSVNFDTWDNDGVLEAPAIEIKWKGQIIASAPFQSSQSPLGITDANAATRDVVIELKADGKMDVSYGGTLVLSNVQTPYDPAAIGAPKWIMGARIGGANDNFWFDDLCISTMPAPGHRIHRLYSTGVDNQGVPLADDAVDPHYVIGLSPQQPAYVATEAGGFPIPPWLGSNSMSAWISPSLDTMGASGGNNTFAYTTGFELTGFNPSTVRIAGRWATDNDGVDIAVNLFTLTGQSNTVQFAGWTYFEITNGFRSGANSLTFVVQNGTAGAPPGSDPTGLRVELWGSGLYDCAFLGNLGGQVPLTITRQPGQVHLSWPAPGFVLQGASDVTGPWRDLTRGESVDGLNHFLTLPGGSPHQFFRLRLDCE